MPYQHNTTYSQRTTGLLTASKVKVLGVANAYLWKVNYYNDKAQLVKSFSQHYLSGSVNAANYDEVSNIYNFEGALMSSTRVHQPQGAIRRSPIPTNMTM